MTWVATVESNHTIRVPIELKTGEQVLIVRIPSLSSLLNDPERRRRFARTRQALNEALHAGFPSENLSDQQIVELVKDARRALRTP